MMLFQATNSQRSRGSKDVVSITEKAPGPRRTIDERSGEGEGIEAGRIPVQSRSTAPAFAIGQVSSPPRARADPLAKPRGGRIF